MTDERRKELRLVLRSYDPKKIAAFATADEIKRAYDNGAIGPNVARSALALVVPPTEDA